MDTVNANAIGNSDLIEWRRQCGQAVERLGEIVIDKLYVR